MQSIVILLFQAFMLPFFAGVTDTATENNANPAVVEIEILNKENLDFKFEVVHKPRRNQIHLRSDESIKTIRLMDNDKAKKQYDVIGSKLVVLPITDFTPGQSHFLEVKFLRSQTTVLAKVKVTEGTVASDL